MRAKTLIVGVLLGLVHTGCVLQNEPRPALVEGSPPPNSTACPVVVPNGRTPPGEVEGPGYHGNESLTAALPEDGRVSGEESTVLADGSIRFKLPWWRDVSGELSITGRNMNNTDADLQIDVPGGYGDTGFQASELVFGSPGCWEVTGSVGDS